MIFVLLFALKWHVRLTIGQGITTTYMASKPHRNICTSQTTPLDLCGLNGTVTGFSGFELELFIMVANMLWKEGHLEWAPGNWSFWCFPFDALFADLENTDQAERFCDIGVSGIYQSNLEGQQSVVKGTNVTYLEGGFRIMIVKQTAAYLWGFIYPLDWKVWIVMFASPVVIAVALLLLETAPSSVATVACHRPQSSSQQGVVVQEPAKPEAADVADTLKRFSEVQWATLGLTVRGIFTLSPHTSGGRVLSSTAFFASILMASIYTSAFFSSRTVKSLQGQVSSLQDLSNRPVGVYTGAAHILSIFPLQDIIQIPWDSLADEQNILKLLRTGQLDAILFDAPFVDYQTSVNCDMYEVGPLFLPTPYTFLFPYDTPDNYIQLFNNVLSTLVKDGTTLQLKSAYITNAEKCSNKGDSAMPTTVTVSNVGGVWVLLASCVGLGAVVNLIAGCSIMRQQKHQQKQVRNKAEGSLKESDQRHPEADTASAVSEDVDRTTTSLAGLCSLAETPNKKDASFKASPPNSQTSNLDYSIEKAYHRLFEVETRLRHMPLELEAILDQKMTDLRADLAGVMTHQLKRAGASGGMSNNNRANKQHQNS
ncbi:hypothetical protein CEUSTIGMA_g11536.t1 [Chlamydomonas eustigma]|uniref:Ionotropic glutamate receptor C-terminal domain-containing protein n=1 Tax=Chlamydomonas eustigma TaxID=1157962 RepID=A0A250XM58_9CHLO|nr:hypothetical protein CEUSTIGMA_g11536.t1 [Chlamydomonas eustigma]|eukprot:GAX84113.1 hypothetical protein CEUSTIGMA_g11536.t1 [Chlamydomonas eustigma]